MRWHQNLFRWIAWWSLGTVALRVIITWLYKNPEQSVFIAVIFHAMFNITWQLFPINGSYYDPRVIMAVVAVFVAIIWGPGKTDSQKTVSPANETLK